jgi:transmembrane sensor
MENDKTHASPDSSLIEKEAVAWFTRMNGKPTLSEKRAFEDWLKRSADHRQAYNEVGSLWGDLGVVANKVADKANGDLEEPLQKIKNCRCRLSDGFCGWLVVLARPPEFYPEHER